MNEIPAINEVRTITDENGEVYMNVHDFEITFISQMYSEMDEGDFDRHDSQMIEAIIDSIQAGLQTFYEE